MALATRRSRRSSIDIWPGFVDALSQLLMVIIFILLVFTAGQFYLSNALSGRDAELQRLQKQINALSQMLALERSTNSDLRAGTASMAAELKASLARRDELTTQLADLAAKAQSEAARADRATGQLEAANTIVSADKQKVELQLKELDSLRRDIAALKTVRSELEAKVSALAAAQSAAKQAAGAPRDRTKELEAKLASAQETTVLAQKKIDKRDIRIRDLLAQAADAQKALSAERAVSRAAQAQINALNQQIAALREQLAQIAAALDISQKKVKQQAGQIVDLGKKLNLALVNKVEELARYRSEFFGKLRKIIGNQPGIHIVGDRFVFQAEVLFKPGSADLGDAAKQQLSPVFAALKQISAKIPNDIGWILRVDGHTDPNPIHTPQFASNWELSTARAISVVRYAIKQGIPANHLAAAGFAATQPIVPGKTPQDYRKDRRIELRLTD